MDIVLVLTFPSCLHLNKSVHQKRSCRQRKAKGELEKTDTYLKRKTKLLQKIITKARKLTKETADVEISMSFSGIVRFTHMTDQLKEKYHVNAIDTY